MILTSENYFSEDASREFLSVSQYKSFMGTLGKPGCEAAALAELNGEWGEDMEESIALMVGSYVDAHFEGTLNIFKAQHPCMFKKDGGLKAEYVKAEEIISRIERDDLFMKYMSGEKQVIMTAEMFGAMWKIKIDSYHVGKCIVDLKIMRELHKAEYTKDYGYMNFIGYWGYLIQGAVYQNIEYLNQLAKCETEEEKEKCHKLPFFIAAASKEKEPDIELIQVEQSILDEALIEVERNTPKVMMVKCGEIEPIRCELCDYCKHTKELKAPILSSDLLGSV